MPHGSHAATPTANGRTEGLGKIGTSKLRLISIISSKARELWRNKVAVELAARAGVSIRTAENYLAGQGINGNALARLLQSDEGPEFLSAIIADLPPSRRAKWDREFEKAALRADLRVKREALERQEQQLT